MRLSRCDKRACSETLCRALFANQRGPGRGTVYTAQPGVVVYSRGASRRLLIARAPAYRTLHLTTLERPSSIDC